MSWISIAGIIVGTLALVIILSVMNGFNMLINSYFSSFDPDVKITSVQGKMFDPDEIDFEQIKNLPGVVHYAEVIEEVAMLKYGNRQVFATVKGVPGNFTAYTNIDSMVIEGRFTLENQGINYAVVGYGVAVNLSVGLTFVDPIRIFVPKKGKQFSLNPARALNYNSIHPSGIFSILEEIDSKYILVPYRFAADLFESGQQISAIELGLDKNYNTKKVQKEIEKIAGKKFHVKNKYQQHDLINKTMKSEKWFIWLILIFILLVASFGILGSLSMLIMDKAGDIKILQSMGATQKIIRQIFLFEGWLISLAGVVIGVGLGLLICWLQIEFGFVTLPGNGSFVITAYPVKIIFTDIVLIAGVVLVVGFLASWYPARFISKQNLLHTNS